MVNELYSIIQIMNPVKIVKSKTFIVERKVNDLFLNFDFFFFFYKTIMSFFFFITNASLLFYKEINIVHNQMVMFKLQIQIFVFGFLKQQLHEFSLHKI